MTRSPAFDASYRELVAALTPTAVSQYLTASRSWRLEAKKDDVSEIWSLLGDGGQPRGRILLPLATDYVDFPERFAEALRAIGIINDWSAAEVEQHVAAVYADMLFIRLEQLQADETIPLKQATVTLDAIYEMMKDAALAVAVPDRARRSSRRIPAAVSAFLDDNVRFAHTQRGSFVFTVICRIADPRAAVPQTSPGRSVGTNFPRRVMETIAGGLEAGRDLGQGGQAGVRKALAKWGLSDNFIRQLSMISGPSDLRSLTLQFEWASGLPEPKVGRGPIRLSRATVGELASTGEMKMHNQIEVRRETLAGQVISLARDDINTSGTRSGAVIISAEVDGRMRNIHMVLIGADHVSAIKAYEMNEPLVVTGDLIVRGHTWRLTGSLEVGG